MTEVLEYGTDAGTSWPINTFICALIWGALMAWIEGQTVILDGRGPDFAVARGIAMFILVLGAAVRLRWAVTHNERNRRWIAYVVILFILPVPWFVLETFFLGIYLRH